MPNFASDLDYRDWLGDYDEPEMEPEPDEEPFPFTLMMEALDASEVTDEGN